MGTEDTSWNLRSEGYEMGIAKGRAFSAKGTVTSDGKVASRDGWCQQELEARRRSDVAVTVINESRKVTRWNLQVLDTSTRRRLGLRWRQPPCRLLGSGVSLTRSQPPPAESESGFQLEASPPVKPASAAASSWARLE